MALKLSEKIDTNLGSSVPMLDVNDSVYHDVITDNYSKFNKTQDNTQKSPTKINTDSQKIKSSVKRINSFNIIDVIRDYDWTYSSKSLIKNSEIPYIHIKEFKILGNSYLSSLMTSTLLFPDIAKSYVDTSSPAANFFQKIQDTFKDNKFGKFMSSIGNTPLDILNKIESTTTKATNWVKTQMEGIDKTANEWGGSKKDLIDNYQYLYLRKPTNTEYKFPYFENDYFNTNNIFQDPYGGDNSLFEGLFNKGLDLLDEVRKISSVGLSLSEPGMFIQRPQFYNFSNNGYEVKVVFYLFNTINEGSYTKNTQLITKLIIRNTPHRHNRLLVDPVCIYELTVPGRGFYPYTYISSLNVNHVGTKRMLEGPNGNQIIVPDAFKVELIFKSLTSEVNNFIIPETGTSGIDVTERSGLGKIIKDYPLDLNTKTTEEKIKSPPTTPSPIPINIPTNIPVNVSSSIGSTQSPIRLARF